MKQLSYENGHNDPLDEQCQYSHSAVVLFPGVLSNGKENVLPKPPRIEPETTEMWSNVVFPTEALVPASRSKHASVLHGQFLYLLGGRNGNVPLKDFWRYCICKRLAI